MFGIFKRKLKIKNFCQKKFDYIFSNSGKETMDKMILYCDLSIEDSQRQYFEDHFIAIYFEIHRIAINTNLSKEITYQSYNIMIDYFKKKKCSYIDEIREDYRLAFNSDCFDGIKVMADKFANEFSTDPEKVCTIFYFLATSYVEEIKKLRIVL